MEFLKNISGEIARSLDSDQVKQDQSSVKDSDETSINAVTNNETPLVSSKINKLNLMLYFICRGLLYDKQLLPLKKL